MVHCLDRAYGQKGLTQAERRKTATVIVDWARDLIDEEESLKTIYNKYNPIDYDSETATEVDDMKSMLEAMLGVDLGDEDISSPEDLLQHAQAHIEQQQVQAKAEATAREARRAARKNHPNNLRQKLVHTKSRRRLVFRSVRSIAN